MSDTKPFSERLLWARSEAGLTQKELASKSGISLPQIVRYEAGRSIPRLGGALKLARVFNMDAHDLVPELKSLSNPLSMPARPMSVDTEAKRTNLVTEAPTEMRAPVTITLDGLKLAALNHYRRVSHAMLSIEVDAPGYADLQRKLERAACALAANVDNAVSQALGE